MKLQEDCQQRGVYVDDATREGLMEILKQGGDQVLPPKSFQELFWKQQKEASDRSDLKGMRWHPLLIRWCLYIHHCSSGAYQVSTYYHRCYTIDGITVLLFVHPNVAGH